MAFVRRTDGLLLDCWACLVNVSIAWGHSTLENTLSFHATVFTLCTTLHPKAATLTNWLEHTQSWLQWCYLLLGGFSTWHWWQHLFAWELLDDHLLEALRVVGRTALLALCIRVQLLTRCADFTLRQWRQRGARWNLTLHYHLRLLLLLLLLLPLLILLHSLWSKALLGVRLVMVLVLEELWSLACYREREVVWGADGDWLQWRTNGDRLELLLGLERGDWLFGVGGLWWALGVLLLGMLRALLVWLLELRSSLYLVMMLLGRCTKVRSMCNLAAICLTFDSPAIMIYAELLWCYFFLLEYIKGSLFVSFSWWDWRRR